jgi:NAD(P)-dependent dehydrogenase (short-subunit alcohol dehydrogenase family)
MSTLTTKGAVDAITRSLAKELGPRGIRVNAINPGMVETGVHAAGIAESDMRKQVEAQTPLGRIGQPQDIATAAVFFASADSAWITGETLTVAGGYHRCVSMSSSGGQTRHQHHAAGTARVGGSFAKLNASRFQPHHSFDSASRCRSADSFVRLMKPGMSMDAEAS